MTNTSYNPWTITATKMTAEAAQHIIDNISEWKIDSIESLSLTEAMLMAEDHEQIKGHDIFFIDFGGYFGYSAVVFYDDHIIRYAGDYELHHKHEGKSHEELKKDYIKKYLRILYTDEELAAPLESYDDYKRRHYYLNNYYGDRENHVSCFHIFNNAGVEEAYRAATENLYMSHVCFSWYESKGFVERAAELYQAVEKAKADIDSNFDYWESAFYYEFGNYECCYGGRYAEAAQATGVGEMNDVQKAAYKAAKERYAKWCMEHDI